MLNIYRTDDKQVNVISGFEPDCWIHLVSPTSQELSWVMEQTGVEPDFLRAPLDEEERSRIETENAQTFRKLGSSCRTGSPRPPVPDSW